jgi:hypothetical protein
MEDVVIPVFFITRGGKAQPFCAPDLRQWHGLERRAPSRLDVNSISNGRDGARRSVITANPLSDLPLTFKLRQPA